MMQDNLLVYLLINISLLLFVATILTELRPLRLMLRRQTRRPSNQICLGIIFGLLSICATYIGLNFHGAIVNTRVISTVAAGLVGGPLSGILAGALSGIHRYFYDLNGFTTLSCSIGTFCFGVIGALFSRRFATYRHRNLALVVITIFSELLQAVIILAMAKPFSAAVELEQAILLPKIVVNSLGLVIFLTMLDRLNRELSIELADQHSLALLIAEQCMPYLREGIENRSGLQQALEIVRNVRPDFRVAFTSQTEYLASSGLQPEASALPNAVTRAITEKQLIVIPPDVASAPKLFQDTFAEVAAPLYSDETVIGCLFVLVPVGQHLVLESEVRIISGMASLFSSMLELGQLHHQIKLRHQAEFRALQAQITPHFLFNSLNTISAMCLTNPDRARENILTLANYFRQTLLINEPFVTLEQELSNVNNYLTLTKARFEDAIHVTWDLPEELPYLQLPPLILQPIVENAVRHGGTTVDSRHIHISINVYDNRTDICVSDKGHGFSPDVLKKLRDSNDPTYTGLFNVRNRLRYIYGERCAFTVDSSDSGSLVSFSVPRAIPDAPDTVSVF